MKERGMDRVYDDIIASFFTNVTAPTIRSLFGFILNHRTTTFREFVSPPTNQDCFVVKTKWVLESGQSDTRTEKYLSHCVAPTSVVMWFWRRTGQDAWLPSLLLTGYHYQNFEQLKAYITCGFDFYTQQRYTDVHFSTMYIICIYFSLSTFNNII